MEFWTEYPGQYLLLLQSSFVKLHPDPESLSDSVSLSVAMMVTIIISTIVLVTLAVVTIA